MNVSWAINELEQFIARCKRHREAYERGGHAAHENPAIIDMHGDAIELVPIVQQIADRTWPEWRDNLRESGFGWEYDSLVQIATQLLVMLRRKDELEQNLGETGPALSVSTMHPDVWDASKSLWRNGHFGEAVSAAAKSINAALQAKVGRRDSSDGRLLADCFSTDPPKPGIPRLRLMKDDGSDTFKNLHGGISIFGQGSFKAIRNVLAHEYGQLAEPPQEEALHYLAAFSTLARWIEKAEVER